MRDTQKRDNIVNLEQTKVKITSLHVFYNSFFLITLGRRHLYNLFNFNIETENIVPNFKSRGYMVEAYFSLQNHTFKEPFEVAAAWKMIPLCIEKIFKKFQTDLKQLKNSRNILERSRSPHQISNQKQILDPSPTANLT